MDLSWAKDSTIDPKLVLGIGGLIVALVVFVLSNRTEKIVDIPIMTRYSLDHERAMMKGALKVSVTTNILVSISSLNPTLGSTLHSFCSQDPATVCNHTASITLEQWKCLIKRLYGLSLISRSGHASKLLKLPSSFSNLPIPFPMRK